MSDIIDLLSVGDTTYDTFVSPTESEAMCTVNDKESFICFSYGDKIPVSNLEFSVGGNAANNAMGTKRLGIHSALITTFGDDTVGDLIWEKLQKENIELSFVTRQKDTESNYSMVINYSGERTIFTYRPTLHYVFPDAAPAVSWVYLTSMAEGYEPFYEATVKWLDAHPYTKLAFNPGSRQVRAGADALSGVLTHTHVIFVNREEAEKLTGIPASPGNEKALLAGLRQLGVKTAIITDGGNGSFVDDGQQVLHCGVLPIDPYERTGAGDAFGSGTLSAMIKGKPLSEALLWGTVNSASVIGYTGSQKGLLRDSEISTWIERAKSSGVGVTSLGNEAE